MATTIKDVFSMSGHELNEKILNLSLQEKRLIYIDYLYSTNELNQNEYYKINNIHFKRGVLYNSNIDDLETLLNVFKQPYEKESILSQDIKIYNQEGISDYDYLDADKIMSEQKELELDLMIEYYNKCSKNIKNVKEEIKNLPDKLQTYFCNNIVEKISQIMTIIFNDEKLITKYIQNIKTLIPTQKSNLYLFNLKYKKEYKFLLKTTKYINEDLLHEGIVGLYALNELNKLIPNFCPVFAILIPNFENEFKFLPENKFSKDEYEDKEKGDTFLVYQYIESSISFRDFVKDCSINDLLPYILQIVFALKIANEKIKFSHYDLHIGNIILHNVEKYKNFYIKYSDSIFIQCNKVAVIIDYELSYFKYGDENLGNLNFSHIGILQNKDNLKIDIYRFLMSIIWDMKFHGNKNYLLLAPLIYFFNIKENIDYILEHQNDFYYLLSPSHKNEFNINDFIDFLFIFIASNNYGNPIKTNKQLNKKDYVLNCSN